jgi:putative hydrolase of the HAD superfamily
MIEAAMTISNNTIPIEIVENNSILERTASKPIVLLDGVEETLDSLFGKYKLVVATKGDLLERRKLHNSGLGHYFHHIEVMSDKQEKDYVDLIKDSKLSLQFFL